MVGFTAIFAAYAEADSPPLARLISKRSFAGRADEPLGYRHRRLCLVALATMR